MVGTVNTSVSVNNGQHLHDTETAVQLASEIKARFGLVPNFFRLASADPTITRNLWGFAQFGYLDNPMPPLFKERLFVYLSRFCDVRYCIARHVAFLVGLGHPAGDCTCVPQTVETVLPLLRRPLPKGKAFDALLARQQGLDRLSAPFPEPDSAGEQLIFACATHLFLQTPDAPRAFGALNSTLSPSDLEHLKVFLSFVRTAHYWTKLHPELTFEEDVAQLLETHEALAACVLNDQEGSDDAFKQRIKIELTSLQELKSQNAAMAKAHDSLSIDYQDVEQRLQDREVILRDLFAAIPAAVYACDAEGHITYFNRRAVELAVGGRSSIEDESSIHDRDAVRVLQAEAPMKAVLASGEPVVNREMLLERPGAPGIHLLLNIAPLRDPVGKVTGAVNIFQNISELKCAQEQRERLLKELQRSNDELSQFSYAVSHDLQGPVRSVRALTQLLVRRNDGPPEDASHLASLIEQAAEGMERLIDSLLRYAHAGQGEIRRQRVSAQAAVDSVRVALGALIAKTNAHISTTTLPIVDADPVQLQQLFQNLIANAIKYHRQGEPPSIEIRGEAIPNGWRFAVKDSGQGIKREHHALIFEPLKRLHGNDTPGSGLGLALCKTIVARHGGRIWVESDGAGHGSIFMFTLASAQEGSGVVGSAGSA